MMNQFNPPSQEVQAIAYLQTPQAIRDRCGQLFKLACQNQLENFTVDLGQLEPTAAYVLQVIRENYPDLKVPFHSRWRHFQAGDVPRSREFASRIAGLSELEQARVKFDLVILSVLLDAGAGVQWQYVEPGTEGVFRRSEGLAIASYHSFCQGIFSDDATQPLRTDASKLKRLTEAELAQGFQVTAENPLVGLEGRVNLLQNLGKTMERLPQFFGEAARPGYLVDYLVAQSSGGKLPARQVLRAVLEGLGDIWAGRVSLGGVNLGDVWPHSALEGTTPGVNLVPFHKLSQWLSYSLLEPLQGLGLEITGLDELTGLAEYRNGGLCLDLGLIQPKRPEIFQERHAPGSEVIVEWRSLTVILLDRVADTIRESLGMDSVQLPLVKVLEGGTWAAGRKIAAERRTGGVPPLQIESDGTVF